VTNSCRGYRSGTRQAGDAGFTLIEVIVAMLIVGGTLVGLLALQTRSALTSQTSRQRQQAAALANQVVEQARGLDVTRMRKGLNSANVTATSAGDKNLNAAGQLQYGLPAPEALVSSSDATAVTPLQPYVQPAAGTTLDGRVYDVRAYVTRPASGFGSDGYWLTVVVRWNDRGRETTPLLLRSFFYSPSTAP
jgi:prepilin-type N-terminal cleavage/methylation domain-containing protein